MWVHLCVLVFKANILFLWQEWSSLSSRLLCTAGRCFETHICVVWFAWVYLVSIPDSKKHIKAHRRHTWAENPEQQTPICCLWTVCLQTLSKTHSLNNLLPFARSYTQMLSALKICQFPELSKYPVLPCDLSRASPLTEWLADRVGINRSETSKTTLAGNQK